MSRFATLAGCALLGALLAAAQPAAAQFEGVVNYRMSAQGQAIDMAVGIKGDDFRTDLTMQGQTFTIITNAAGDRQIMVMHQQRQWMDLKAMQEAMAAMMGRMGGLGAMMGGAAQPPSPPTSIDVRPTGQSETVAGHQCDHYIITADGDDVDVCAATGLGGINAISNSMAAMAQAMGGMAMGMGGRGGGMGSVAQGVPMLSPEQTRMFEERFANGFFPLKVTFAQDGTTGSMEVTSIDQRAIEASYFQPPAGFQEMRIPGR